MSDQIFRKKSLDRISSPEQLNDYIRVANPGHMDDSGGCHHTAGRGVRVGDIRSS